MTSLSSAILATLTYSDHFNFPLRKSELYSRLIRFPSSPRKLAQTLSQLVEREQITCSGDFYHLPGREKTIALRQQKAHHCRHELSRLLCKIRPLTHVPGVLALYLTGSRAVNNSDPQDDIDLMVITRGNQLWTTRFFLTLYCELLGLRRRPHDPKGSGKLCLNLYLDSSTLALPATKRTLYSAYELVQAVPLYDPIPLNPHLFHQNRWILDFLPNHPMPADPVTLPPPSTGVISRLFELLAYHSQLLFMRRRLTREYITPHSAFFHPRDPSQAILAKLKL